MKLVIPVSHNDIARARTHAQVLKHFGGLDFVSILYYCTPDVVEQASEIAAINGATLAVMQVQPERGWPIGPNQQFSALVFHLGSIGNREPFLWMETDMFPVCRGWLKKLTEEYSLKGKSFMGNVVPIYIKGVPVPGDFMMMGCGVYPAGMERDERIRWAIVNLGKGGDFHPSAGGRPLSFDLYLRHPLQVIGMADTSLISDQWNTGKYQQTDEGLVCEALPFDRPHRQRGGRVSPEAVLVHGCKDDSLPDLLLGRKDIASQMIETWSDPEIKSSDFAVQKAPPFPTLPLIEVPKPSPAPALPPTPFPIVSPTASAWDVLQKPHPANKPVHRADKRSQNVKPMKNIVQAVTADPELVAKVNALLADAPYRLKDLAKKVGIRFDVLERKLLVMGLQVAKGGWIKPIETTVKDDPFS